MPVWNGPSEGGSTRAGAVMGTKVARHLYDARTAQTDYLGTVLEKKGRKRKGGLTAYFFGEYEDERLEKENATLG